MRRRRGSVMSIAANPVLVGATTVLVVVVAVFLAYNANNGLPFIPTTQMKVLLPNGANVLAGNEIREGGYRIGVIEDMRPVQLADGTTVAEANIEIDKAAGRVPEDSTITVRLRSNLGLKFLELHRGRSTTVLADGDTLPVAQARIPVELDDYFSTFDAPTRRNMQRALLGGGDALTQRGSSLNTTIADLPRLLGYLEPVMRALADRRSANLPRFVKELGDVTRTLAPVAGPLSREFTVAADTFEAWSRDPAALSETIRRFPASLDAGIRSFPVQRPFLRDLATLSRSLRRATDELDFALPRITPALRAGPPVLRRTPESNEELRKVLAEARKLFEDPATMIALRGLDATVSSLNPTLRFVGPYVTVCNYFNYALSNVGEHVTEPDTTGFAQRTQLGIPPRQLNTPGSLGATAPANGEEVVGGTPAFLHVNVGSAAVDEKGNADCESGQRGYVQRAARYAPEKYKIVIDPRIPGDQGPTYAGRPRVLEGQTFSRTPQLGPTFPPELDTP